MSFSRWKVQYPRQPLTNECLFLYSSMEIPGHFFGHKGEEMGYLLSGRLRVTIGNTEHTLRPGDAVYLTADQPTQWGNLEKDPAEIQWIKAR